MLAAGVVRVGKGPGRGQEEGNGAEEGPDPAGNAASLRTGSEQQNLGAAAAPAAGLARMETLGWLNSWDAEAERV